MKIKKKGGLGGGGEGVGEGIIHNGSGVKIPSGSLQEDSPSHLATVQNEMTIQFQLGSYLDCCFPLFSI